MEIFTYAKCTCIDILFLQRMNVFFVCWILLSTIFKDIFVVINWFSYWIFVCFLCYLCVPVYFLVFRALWGLTFQKQLSVSGGGPWLRAFGVGPFVGGGFLYKLILEKNTLFGPPTKDWLWWEPSAALWWGPRGPPPMAWPQAPHQLDPALLGINYILLGINNSLLGINCRLLRMIYKLTGINYRLQGTNYRLLGLNYRLLWMVYELQASGVEL